MRDGVPQSMALRTNPEALDPKSLLGGAVDLVSRLQVEIEVPYMELPQL